MRALAMPSGGFPPVTTADLEAEVSEYLDGFDPGLWRELERTCEDVHNAGSQMVVAPDGLTLVNGQIWNPAARIAEAYKIRVNAAFQLGDQHQLMQMRSSMLELDSLLGHDISIGQLGSYFVEFREVYVPIVRYRSEAEALRAHLREIVKALLTYTTRRLAVLIRWTNNRDAVTDTVIMEMPFFLVNGCHPPEVAHAVVTSGT